MPRPLHVVSTELRGKLKAGCHHSNCLIVLIYCRTRSLRPHAGGACDRMRPIIQAGRIARPAPAPQEDARPPVSAPAR